MAATELTGLLVAAMIMAAGAVAALAAMAL
jgi:hypothetical protein